MKDKPKDIPDQKQPIPGSEEKMHPQPVIIRKNYRGSEKLKNKVALITGGDSGIGRSVAVHFAREGADISIIYLSEDEDALITKSLVEAEGRECLIIAGNIQDKKFCDSAVAKTKKKFGTINILVNNAAEQHEADTLEELDLSLMEESFRTNVFGMFYITKKVVPEMKAGDSIINTTSVTSYRGSDHLMDYSSTKGAVTAFTRSLSLNLADRKIRVNGVAPGPIWTPLIPSTLENVSKFGKKTALGRVGQPSEVGPAYVFLASEDASYITGNVIHINGGDFVNT
ncbi:MAG: NAD(P)-dependent oxidoreductase [Ignavibacteriae bacterium HGW-Ignavibacteriae-1]|jgi:NAD(P)-dependent dehydrogenase (short-subunit alcohol dehydrogenase family)|nr:MAG: NAD(P)-dependent oxidoreductase [Ignavibacteriae bacterium HGW-Ignavibacteriae-1]